MGRVVYGNNEFKNLSPELPPASPDWSPTGVYGYGGANLANTILSHSHDNKLHSCSNPLHQHTHTVIGKMELNGVLVVLALLSKSKPPV